MGLPRHETCLSFPPFRAAFVTDLASSTEQRGDSLRIGIRLAWLNRQTSRPWVCACDHARTILL